MGAALALAVTKHPHTKRITNSFAEVRIFSAS
jgi:hypothetical protein